MLRSVQVATAVTLIGLGTTAMPKAVSAQLLVHDTFDVASCEAPDFGLNSSLDARQTGEGSPVTYSRRSGVWYEGALPTPSDVQVNPTMADGQGRLVFQGAAAAVRLDTPIETHGRAVRISVRTDPSTRDSETMSWVSLMLSTSAESAGWPTGSDLLFGIYLRSNGMLHVTSGGVERSLTWTDGPPDPSEESELSVTLEESLPGDTQMRLSGTLNGAAFTVSSTPELAELAHGRALFLYLGAHFHPESVPMVSWIDDLRIESVGHSPQIR